MERVKISVAAVSLKKQHQAWPRWRAYRSALRRRKFAATIPSRSGAGGCWNRVLEEPTTSRCQRSKGFTLPSDVSASKRYWDEDIIEPEVEVTSMGAIHVPKVPGLAYLVRRDRIERLTVRTTNWIAQLATV